jgi:hypothetical protein
MVFCHNLGQLAVFVTGVAGCADCALAALPDTKPAQSKIECNKKAAEAAFLLPLDDPTRGETLGLRRLTVRANQAIDTAMNANRNISTPPTMGSTMGIMGTTSSTGSAAWWSSEWWGADIANLKNSCGHDGF